LSLATEALQAALDDSGFSKDDIDGLLTMPGTTTADPVKHYLRLGEHLGIDPKIAGSLNAGGATAGMLIQQAALAIDAGMAEVVAVVFGDAARTGGSRFSAPTGAAVSSANWGMYGNAANSALGARRHMALYGTTSEQLGWVAVNNRRNASLNPDAVMREPITIADHQNSRMIVDPLHLFDCCLISDGGVAIIVASAERARDTKHGGVKILGMGQGHTLQTLERKDWWYLPHQQDCISRAYLMAGLSPADIDVAQLYDNFTISVLFWLEHGGFVKPGESGPFVEGGQRIALEGELPINTAGGNLSESYMQGWLHVVEGVRQMRGQSGPRQIAGARTCLVTGRGMALQTSSCLILGTSS
jgi:acetyl-CoA acetyltransferase